MPNAIVYADSSAFTQKSVHRIFQDASGFLWFGTQDGAVRFDGAFWRRVSVDDGLGANHVTAIAQSPDGAIYFGSVNGGLSVHDPKKQGEHGGFARRLAGEDVRDVVYARSRLWVGTSRGICVIDGERETWIECGDVLALCVSQDGRAWAATRKGAVVIEGSRVAATRRDLALGAFAASCIFEDAGGDIWVGTLGGGLVRLPVNDGLARGYTSADGLPNDHVMCGVRGMAADELWVGTWGAGVSHVRMRPLGGRCVFTTVSSKDGVGNDNIRSLCCDREGALWIGTGGRGATRYQKGERVRRFVSYTKADGLAHNMVACITQDAKNRYWFGSFGGGVCSFSPDSRTGRLWRSYTTADGLSHDTVRAAFADSWDRIWFGTAGGGISRFRPELNEWKRFTTAEGLTGNIVRTLQPMRNGELWAGTDGGISCLMPEHTLLLRNYLPHDGLPTGTVLSIVERDEQVWVATLGGGVARLIHNEWQPIEGLPSAAVTCLLPLPDGDWLMGTYGAGLIWYRGKDMRVLRPKDGLPHDIVYGLVADPRGRIFGTTVRGVFELSFRNGEPVLRTFDQTDGLADDESNGGAAFCDRGGRLWFGTIGGVSELSPSSLPAEVEDATALITDFRVNRRPASTAGDAQVRGYEMTFEYAVVDYRAPTKVVFQCRLEGLEHEWLPLTTARTLRYTNLAAGPYTFVVRARGFSGVFGPEARLSFVVTP